MWSRSEKADVGVREPTLSAQICSSLLIQSTLEQRRGLGLHRDPCVNGTMQLRPAIDVIA